MGESKVKVVPKEEGEGKKRIEEVATEKWKFQQKEDKSADRCIFNLNFDERKKKKEKYKYVVA